MDESLIRFPNLERVLEQYAIEFRNTYQDSLITNDRIASGDLLNSVDYIIEKGNNKYTVSLKLKDYYYFVENGRKAGKFPPPDAMLRYVQIKPVLPRPMKNGKLPTEKQLAFLIGRKIAREGTEGSKDLQKTATNINTKFIPLFYEAIDKDIDGMAITIFNNFTNPKWN